MGVEARGDYAAVPAFIGIRDMAVCQDCPAAIIQALNGDVHARAVLHGPVDRHGIVLIQVDVVAGARRVVQHHGAAVDVDLGVLGILNLNAAALAGGGVAGDLAAVQVQRRAADIDAAAVAVLRLIAGDLAAVDRGGIIPQADAAAVALGGVVLDRAAGHRHLALGEHAAALVVRCVALDHAVLQRQRGILLVPHAAAVAVRVVAANLAVFQLRGAAVVVVDAAAARPGRIPDDLHALDRDVLRAAVVDTAGIIRRVAGDRAARQVQRAFLAAVDAAAAARRYALYDHAAIQEGCFDARRFVARDCAAFHPERAVRVHAAAQLGLVAGDRAALQHARGALLDVDAAAALGVAALDYTRSDAVDDRQRGLAFYFNDVSVVVLRREPAVHAVSVQLECDALTALQLDPAALARGNVLAQADHLAVLGVLERFLQAVPVADPHVCLHRQVDEQLAILQCWGHALLLVVGERRKVAAAGRQATRQHLRRVLRQQVQFRAVRKLARHLDGSPRAH